MDADVLHPFVVDNFMLIVGGVPAYDAIDNLGFIVDGGDFFGERDANRLRRFGIEVHL